MLADYIRAALKKARYERLEDGEEWFATIAGFPGLWASEKTVEETRDELASGLEGWIILALRHGETLPVIEGIDLTPELVAPRAS